MLLAMSSAFATLCLVVPALMNAVRASAIPLVPKEVDPTPTPGRVFELDNAYNFTLRGEDGTPGASGLVKRFDQGRFSFYDAGLGACGKVNSGSDFIVALNIAQWANKAHCFESITISYRGKTATAQITDLCPGCPFGGLDMSRGLFSYFADQSVGIIYGSWNFGGSAPQAAAAPPPPPVTTPRPTPRPTPTTPATTRTTPAYTPPPPPPVTTRQPSPSPQQLQPTTSAAVAAANVVPTPSVAPIPSAASPPGPGLIAVNVLAEMNKAFVELGRLAANARLEAGQ